MLRFTVQGDSEAETAEGLRLLIAAGLQPAMPPRQVTDQRWMARAVPRMAKAPTAESSRGPVMSG